STVLLDERTALPCAGKALPRAEINPRPGARARSRTTGAQRRNVARTAENGHERGHRWSTPGRRPPITRPGPAPARLAAAATGRAPAPPVSSRRGGELRRRSGERNAHLIGLPRSRGMTPQPLALQQRQHAFAEPVGLFQVRVT